ncbi:MAG TPA: hypothetical protein VGM57_07575 [Pseudolabrys sp.]
MIAIRLKFGIAACAVLACAAVVPREARAAGGAYVVDTADVGDPGDCKVESWLSSSSYRDMIASTSPTCVLGFPKPFDKPVEASVQIQRTRFDQEWGTSFTPKLKTNLVPTAIGSWGVAVSGQASYDGITGENTALAATIPATLRLSNVVRVNLNGGWQWDRIADQHYFTYGAGADWRTPDNVWTVTAEVFGQLGSPQDTHSLVQPRFQLGLRWRPVDEFNIDLIYGRNIAGENANWLTLATTFRFSAGK